MKSNHVDIKNNDISSLLSGLRSDPVLTGNFEQKFLNDFHHKIHAQQQSKTILGSIGEKLGAFFAHISPNKWAYKTAATTMTTFIVALVAIDIAPNNYSVTNLVFGTYTRGLQHVNCADNGIPFNDAQNGKTCDGKSKEKKN